MRIFEVMPLLFLSILPPQHVPCARHAMNPSPDIQYAFPHAYFMCVLMSDSPSSMYFFSASALEVPASTTSCHLLRLALP
jgi:hypothetical protein